MHKVDELLPCPFCGSEASDTGIVRYDPKMAKQQRWGQDTFYFCNCPSCGVSNVGLVGHASPQTAIEAWNRRAAPPPPADDVVEAFDRVTYDDKGRLDEVVGSRFAHLERMDSNRWFLLIGHFDGTETAIWFTSRKFPNLIERRGPHSKAQERGK